jgi:serine/threonine protein phosphatase PrpC
VFDGHGGLECAKFCERFFEAKLREQPEFVSKKDLPKALESTFLGLDRMLMTPKGMEAMIQISKEHPNQISPVERALRFHADKSALNSIKQNQYSIENMEGKGCTANVCMIAGSVIICANAGDSRAVVAENGRAIPLSIDHKPTLKKERERIYKAGSTVNIEGRIDGNLNLSRAILRTRRT